ncbi:MAG: cysteine--tRNA ligase [Chloroflexi bacterium]|nr:cysteine--tRNA ligase [Chloroflexota bacterium]
MPLTVFNRLTRQKEEFKPLTEGEVKMYVCGPTVYDHAHLGHAKTYVAFDVIVRYLRYTGYKVRYVQNITDVGHLLETDEDRVIRKAGQLGLEPMEVVETYARSFFQDMDALNVIRPDISPQASGHIPEQIEMTQGLIEKGYAYVTDVGDVYFDVTKWPEYGKLSGRSVEDAQSERQIVGSEKRNSADFALWRHAEPEHLMQWDSPWGRGFPGWHIECSAMSKKYLGETFDIHGGGLENQHPHNDCEIAQSEALHEKPFANYWLLTGSLTIDGEKMSKSLGNFVTIKEALEQYRPEALRYFLLSSHYRGPIDYSDEALKAASGGWDGLMVGVQRVRFAMKDAPEDAAGSDFLETVEKRKQAFLRYMNDDFNTPQAIAELQELTTDVNRFLDQGQVVGMDVLTAINDAYNELGGQILGVVPETITIRTDLETVDPLLMMLIDIRSQARKDKDYARADAIRDHLSKLGIVLEDGPEGTYYRAR